MRPALAAAATAIVVSAIAILAVSACSQPVDDPWHAGAATLLRRAERLSASGDLEAAAAVTSEIEGRGDQAALARARMALSRARLAAGDTDGALDLAHRVPWADKSPAVAGERIALELAIRWRELLDQDGGLGSGMVPAIESADSDHGQPGGGWSRRRDAYAAIRALIDGGVRMVGREGGLVAMPAPAGLLALARFAYGGADWTSTTAAIGEPASWDAATAHAIVGVAMAEHDLDLARVAAERLWDGHAGDPLAADAFRRLRAWQLRRRALDGILAFWPYPELEGRLDAEAVRFAAAEAAARAVVAGEDDVGHAGLEAGVRRGIPELSVQVETSGEVPGVLSGESEWKLALQHDGLGLEAPSLLALGEPLPLAVSGIYGGAHAIALWRIDDDAAWSRLQTRPDRADLPSQPSWSRVLTDVSRPIIAEGLAEGRYVATLTARASPVVVLRSLRIAASAMHVQMSADGLLAWVVDRRSGHGEAGAAVRVQAELRREPRRAAGPAWDDATPAWRAGFAEGYLGHPDPAFASAAAAADLQAGRAAGARAAVVDPPAEIAVELGTGRDGLLRWSAPAAWVGRPWDARLTLARPSAYETVRAGWRGEEDWAVRAACWADKPLVRPGERLRFAALLRERSGERFRLPASALPAELRIADEPLWSGELLPDACGMVSGEALVPAGALEGQVRLRLGGSWQTIAVCDRLALPPLSMQVADAEAGPSLAGSTRVLRVQVRDQAGEPIANARLDCDVSATALDGGEVPSADPATVETDLAGEAELRIPTIAGREAAWRVSISTERQGRRWRTEHGFATSSFPFPLAAAVGAGEQRAGGVLRVLLEMPAGAAVDLRLLRGADELGDADLRVVPAMAQSERLIALEDAHAGADRLRISAPVPGGGRAERFLAIAVQPRVEAAASVVCMPDRTRLRPGEEVQVTIGASASGRDLLLVAATASVQHASVERVAEAVATVRRPVDPSWGPQTALRCLAWLPGRGFVASAVAPLQVLPVDRLLRVAIAVDRPELRPGERVAATVTVRDWRDQPVAGASLTLGAVDERLYRIEEDPTPDLWRYFHDHARPWRQVDGAADVEGTVRGLLWRSVVHRWVGTGAMFGSRCGGGRGRAVGRAGGSRGSSGGQELRSLGSEADPTIAWFAGVRTAADGTATVSFELPDEPASWRLTARAADGSASVLVGEVRTVLAARRPLGLHLSAPRLARPGDRITAEAEIANHGAAARTVRLAGPAGTSEVVVEARGRRSVPIAIPVPEPPSDAPVRRLGELLGQTMRIAVRIEEGTPDAQEAACELLVAAPGLPQAASLRLVAGADGSFAMPLDLPVGALAEMQLRLWPDAAARRASELQAWRGRDGARGAIAWLFAADGAQRRSALAGAWSALDQEPEAHLVRLAARRRGEASGSIAALPSGLLGDWLRARARSAGLAVSAPRLRGAAPADLEGRILLAGTALAEGWSEGGALWLRLAGDPELLNAPVRSLVLALDAARLAGDAAMRRRLEAAVAVAPWDDAFAAILAVELLPESGDAPAAPLRIAGGDREEDVDARAGLRWAGRLASPVRLSGRPGSLLAIDLCWQGGGSGGTEASPRLRIAQAGDDGYHIVADGDPLWPGTATALIIDLRGLQGAWILRTALPALLQPAASPEAGVFLVEGRAASWPLPESCHERFIAACRRGEPAREEVLAILDRALAEARPAMRPNGVRIGQMLDGGRVGDLIDQELPGGSLVAVPLGTLGDGEASWPESELIGPDGAILRLRPQPLRIAAGHPAAIESSGIGHPLRQAILAAAGRAEVVALGDLIYCDRDEDWQQALRSIDPQAEHSLQDLLLHPLCGRPGHWSVRELRRWVEGEPAVQRLPADADWSLRLLVRLAHDSRRERDEARLAIHGVQDAARPAASLRAWFDAAVAAGRLPRQEWEDWLWRQELDVADLADLGYDRTVDGWVSFCRQELELPMRVGAGMRGGMPWQGGAALGTVPTATGAAFVIERAAGVMTLRPPRLFVRAEPAPIAVDFADTDFAQALATLNQLLANRGLPGLALADGADAALLPPVTLRADTAWTKVADAMALAAGLERAGLLMRPLP